MTFQGGLHDSGCVFSIDTNGMGYKDILDFYGPNGAYPWMSSLILSGSMLYGMTEYGGAYNTGCMFSIDTNGSGYIDRHDFSSSNGEYPNGDLTLSGSVCCMV